MKQRSIHKIQKQLDRELRHKTWLEKNLKGSAVLKRSRRKGKDKSHTDANEDRDDSGDIEEFALS